MPLSTWQALGTGDVLGFLRADLKQARYRVWIIGPWIDAFFAEFVVGTLPSGVELRVVTRPEGGANSGFAEHALAARAHFESRPITLVKLLPRLHAKVVVVDEETAYCGSANWYRYSLEESREIVFRGPTESVSGLLDEIQVIWDQATNEPMQEKSINTTAISQGYEEEVIDPVVAAKLTEVPGAFLIKRRPRSR
ncbi:MAG: hypothetical protein HQK55_00890 [Deltaproteobacteria bacterium]|nr:hypothetical protein [Deltaproteobacteria bacterium]